MKAIQLESPKSFRKIEISEPGEISDVEALVRVHRVGICGTDFSGFLGKMPFFTYPRVPGHELGVEVIAVGKRVTNVSPGDLCSVEPYMNCGRCAACARGSTNCCENLKVLGVMMDGGLTERVKLPARKLHRANKLTLEQCALVETLAIGCHSINRGKAATNETILIVGAGPIGLSAAEFSRLAGARTILMDLSEQRLEFAHKTMDFPDTILSTGDGAELQKLADMTDGSLATLVVDATGNNESMSKSLNYCAFAGRLVYVGITQGSITFPHAPVMHRRELTILASRNALPEDFTRIIGIIEEGRIDTSRWITHQAGFEEMIGVFADWLNPAAGVIKAMVAVN